MIKDFIISWLKASWEVLSMASPWLLFGFFLAGLIKVFLPTSFITKHLKEKGIKSILKASAIGVPLPLCSCSVIPVAVSLRKAGASRAAVGSFLVSTPEIGVDSFILSYGMLGQAIAFIRMIAAFFSAFLVGLLIDLFASAPEANAGKSEDLLCSSHTTKPCCEKEEENKLPNHRKRFGNSLQYAFVDLIDDIAVSLIIGFLAAGLISVLIPNDYNLGSNLTFFQQLIVVLSISIPLYVCASSSTPIAAILLAKGMNVGVVLVFLLVGPATNIATVMVVIKELGKKAFCFYIFGISFVALVFAILIDRYLILDLSRLSSIANMEHHHDTSIDIFSYIMAFLILQSIISQVKRATTRVAPTL